MGTNDDQNGIIQMLWVGRAESVKYSMIECVFDIWLYNQPMYHKENSNR